MPEPDARFHAVHAAVPETPVDGGGGGVVVRVATRGREPHAAYLRTEPDHEERLARMTPEHGPGPWRSYTAVLAPVAHDPITHYAFLFTFDGDQRWLAQDGLHPFVPEREVHFKRVAHYAPAAWIWDQVVYQVFPDRFRDGDPDNNVRDGAYTYGGSPVIAKRWDELPRRGDGPREFYGGDLDGVREALPYLTDLGVSTLYLNPIFTSPSSHKYDTVDYDHVDPHLGGDEAFARLLGELRSRGMRIVLDAVVNHTSERHPWFGKPPAPCGSPDPEWPDPEWPEPAGRHEPLPTGTPPGAYADPTSPTRDHYVFDDAADPESYAGWAGVRTLPVLDFASQGVCDKIYAGDDAVLRRWLRPPWGIDGWRIDVAHMLGEGPGARANHHHLRAIRAAVREERPDAYLLGEHFCEATEWLQGDQEDGAMNYDGFLRPMLAFFAGTDFRGHAAAIDAAGLDGWLARARARLPFEIQLSQLNLLDSHDVPRFRTRVGGDLELLAAAAHVLFTYVGVPSIYYGDEIGLEGGPDPDCRRPFPWDEGSWHHALRERYRALAWLRRRSPPLARGRYQTLAADGDVFAFGRVLGGEAVVTVVNRGEREQPLALRVWSLGAPGPWHDALDGSVHEGDEILPLVVGGRSARTLVTEPAWLAAAGGGRR